MGRGLHSLVDGFYFKIRVALFYETLRVYATWRRHRKGGAAVSSTTLGGGFCLGWRWSLLPVSPAPTPTAQSQEALRKYSRRS